MKNTPFVETDCTIQHAGRSFTAGGAVVTENRLIAYPAENEVLKDWHGNAIGTYRVLSTRPAVFFGHQSWMGSTYYFMRATVNGIRYSLRGFGVGMVASGKRVK